MVLPPNAPQQLDNVTNDEILKRMAKKVELVRTVSSGRLVIWIMYCDITDTISHTP